MKCKVQEFDELYQSMNASSSAVGFIIGLGRELIEDGAKDLDEVIVPALDKTMENEVVPRVSLGYSILLWFAVKVK